MCRAGTAAAGQRERRGRAAQVWEEQQRRTQEGQPRAEAGRDRDAPEFTLEIKLFPNKSLYAETFDDCQFVKNLWHCRRGACIFTREHSLGFPGGLGLKNPPATQETPVPPLGREDPLEEGMATHSSILAWRIPRTEEPVRLQSMGS